MKPKFGQSYAGFRYEEPTFYTLIELNTGESGDNNISRSFLHFDFLSLGFCSMWDRFNAHLKNIYETKAHVNF